MLGIRRLSTSIRARLTVWYALVLAAILVIYAGGVYLFLRQNLYRELDRRLHDDFEAAEENLERGTDGGIRIVRRDRRHHDDGARGERWVEVWTFEGELLHREGPEQPALPSLRSASGAFLGGSRDLDPLPRPAAARPVTSAPPSPSSGLTTRSGSSGTAVRVMLARPNDRETAAVGGARPEKVVRLGQGGREGEEASRGGERARTGEIESVATGAGVILRVHSGTHTIGDTPLLIRVARSEMALRHELGEFLAGMGLGLPMAVLLACLGGYFLAGRALKPVGQMAAQAGRITAERLEERLPIENPDDELGRLGTVFNDTLARLERSFQSLRRFTADAAHELRTPLTALRTEGEVALRRPQTDRSPEEVIGSMLEEVDRLGHLVDALLTLSRSDSGRVSIQAQRLDLQQFAEETVEDLNVLADEKQQRLAVDAEPGVYIHADPRLLRQAVSNILDNAIRHSPEGAPIRVAAYRTVREGTDEAVVDVIDQGPGIEPEHRDRIFERFYRVDKGRSREAGGAGLGLSIAQWAVQASGGSIELDSRIGVGSTFRIRLRLADEGMDEPNQEAGSRAGRSPVVG